MKIVLMGPYGSGSSVRSILYYISRYLSCYKNIDVYVITHNTISKDIINGLKNTNIKLIYIKKKDIPNMVYQIKYHLDTLDPDIIHAFSIPYALAAKKSNNKLYTCFGVLNEVYKYRGFPRDQYNFISLIFEKYIFNKYKYITVESNYNRNIIIKYTRCSNVFVIPTGIDLPKINEIKRKISNNSCDIDLFYIGRLSNEKGVDILIKSIYYVSKEIKDIKVYIAGSGPQRFKLIELSKKLNLNKNIKFLGYINEFEKYKYYYLCKLFIVPSRWDFSPTTILEAFAFGKPVIASSKTHSDAVVDGYTGVVFKSKNIHDLSNKIIYLMQDSKFRKKISTNIKKIIKNYSWRKISDKYIELYNYIVQK